MREIIFYTLGIWGSIMFGCFISWVFDKFSDNNWRKKVTAEDLRELRRLFNN